MYARHFGSTHRHHHHHRHRHHNIALTTAFIQEHKLWKCSIRPMHKTGINGLHLHHFPFDLWFNTVWGCIAQNCIDIDMKIPSNKVKNTCEASNVIDSHIKQNQNFLCATKKSRYAAMESMKCVLSSLCQQ